MSTEETPPPSPSEMTPAERRFMEARKQLLIKQLQKARMEAVVKEMEESRRSSSNTTPNARAEADTE